MLQIYLDYFKENNINKIAVVDESLCNDLNALKIIFSNFQQFFAVKIIFYVRDHADWANSAYKQWGIYHKVNSGQIPAAKFFFDNYNPISYSHFINNLLDFVPAADLIICNYNRHANSVGYVDIP